MEISYKIDPLNKYPDISKEDIENSLGYIPGWLFNEGCYNLKAKEALDKQYIFGMFETSGSTISEEGIHSYPNDSDLYPLIKIRRNDETIYQYRYAIVAIVQEDGSTFVTRMD